MSEKRTVICPKCQEPFEYANTDLVAVCPKCGMSMPNPFNGMEMKCCVCGARAVADENLLSHWRALQVALTPKRIVTYYICPKEMPADGAPAKAFAKAYRKVFACIGVASPADVGLHGSRSRV